MIHQRQQVPEPLELPQQPHQANVVQLTQTPTLHHPTSNNSPNRTSAKARSTGVATTPDSLAPSLMNRT